MINITLAEKRIRTDFISVRQANVNCAKYILYNYSIFFDLNY